MKTAQCTICSTVTVEHLLRERTIGGLHYYLCPRCVIAWDLFTISSIPSDLEKAKTENEEVNAECKEVLARPFKRLTVYDNSAEAWSTYQIECRENVL